MPASHRVEQQLHILTLAGTTTRREAAALLGQLAAELLEPPRLPLLVDARESTDALSTEAVERAVRLVASLRHRLGSSFAIVAGDPEHYGLARMFQAYGEFDGLAVSIFGDFTEARRWVLSQARQRDAGPPTPVPPPASVAPLEPDAAGPSRSHSRWA